MTSQVRLPTGWEQKYDETSQRFYYVDHAHQQTQWDDPRLTHPVIWKGPQVELLSKFKTYFPSVDEMTLRQSLINTCFDGKEAARLLVASGYQLVRPVSPHPRSHDQAVRNGDNSSPASQVRSHYEGHSPRSNQRSGHESRQSQRGSDPESIAFTSLRVKFPNVNTEIIKDTLLNCNHDVTIATERLRGMGFGSRHESPIADRTGGRGSRIGVPKVSQISNVSDAGETDSLVGPSNHHAVADAEMWGKIREREVARQREDDAAALEDMQKRAVVMLGVEFSAFDESVIRDVISKCDGNVDEARAKLRSIESRVKERAESDASGEAATPASTSPDMAANNTCVKTIDRSGDTGLTSPVQQLLPPHGGHRSGSLASSVPAPKYRPFYDTASAEANLELITSGFVSSLVSGKTSSGATRSRSAYTSQATTPKRSAMIPLHSSLAKGPNPDLAKGPNSTLLCGSRSLARGSDPALCKGPSVDNLMDPGLRLRRSPGGSAVQLPCYDSAITIGSN